MIFYHAIQAVSIAAKHDDKGFMTTLLSRLNNVFIYKFQSGTTFGMIAASYSRRLIA